LGGDGALDLISSLDSNLLHFTFFSILFLFSPRCTFRLSIIDHVVLLGPHEDRKQNENETGVFPFPSFSVLVMSLFYFHFLSLLLTILMYLFSSHLLILFYSNPGPTARQIELDPGFRFHVGYSCSCHLMSGFSSLKKGFRDGVWCTCIFFFSPLSCLDVILSFYVFFYYLKMGYSALCHVPRAHIRGIDRRLCAYADWYWCVGGNGVLVLGLVWCTVGGGGAFVLPFFFIMC
jgi:hypothetical protein